MGTERAKRVGRQVLQEISAIVEQELRDPGLKLITFTAVQMSPDLRAARIRFSCVVPERDRTDCQAALLRAAGYLRREVGKRLRLRHVPELRFEYDDSAARAERISRLLATSGNDPGDDGT